MRVGFSTIKAQPFAGGSTFDVFEDMHHLARVSRAVVTCEVNSIEVRAYPDLDSPQKIADRYESIRQKSMVRV